MLTVAYCRVSTEEQAADGFSIDGQAAKLEAYARLHDLGPVTVIADPGASGRSTKRPGLGRLVRLVESGDVAHVLLWRLDRLSRDLGDTIALARLFEVHGVGIHSVTENLDLASPTGRMFFHILGSFAQFYREQLAENVTMGLAQARAEGRWVNRPPTGYDLVDGVLVPNEDAGTVRRVFELRAAGASQPEIERATGVKHSTVVAMLANRAYLGEIRHRDQWSPGTHEALVTPELFAAAHRGRTPGVKRGRDLMSGRVRCGLCGRAMSIQANGQGQRQYRCKHRGHGCGQPARSNRGLLRAAVHTLGLLDDAELRDAIRAHLGERRRTDEVRRRRRPERTEAIAALRDEQAKLVALHHRGLIDDDLLGREQRRLRAEIDQLDDTTDDEAVDEDLGERFEALLHRLRTEPVTSTWADASDGDRRRVLDELLGHVEVHPDWLTVTLHDAPPLRVAYSEVGLLHSGLGQEGGAT